MNRAQQRPRHRSARPARPETGAAIGLIRQMTSTMLTSPACGQANLVPACGAEPQAWAIPGKAHNAAALPGHVVAAKRVRSGLIGG